MYKLIHISLNRRGVLFVLLKGTDAVISFRVFLESARSQEFSIDVLPTVSFLLPGNERGLKLHGHARGTARVTDMPEVPR